MKKLVIVLILIIALLASSSCTVESSVPEEPDIVEEIPAEIREIGENWHNSSQCIWEDVFVGVEYIYGEHLEGQYIFTYNLRTGEKERLIEFDPSESRINPPSIYKNLVVWSEADISGMQLGSIDWQNLNRDIYLLDMETGKIQKITDDEHVQEGALISGETIVWLDDRHGTGEPYPYPAPLDIYAFNLATGEEKRITAASTAEGYGYLAISGDLIVWSDSRHADPEVKNRPSNVADYNNEIYVYDLTTGQERRITDYPGNDHYPAIHGNRIAWLRQLDLRQAEIIVYDLETGRESRVSSSGYAAYSPSIYEDRVVWSDAGISKGNTSNDVVINGQSGGADIYLYDFSSDKETLLVPSQVEGEYKETTFRQVLLNPVIYGDFIICTHSRQIGPLVYAVKLDKK
jgi:hypothetical protein